MKRLALALLVSAAAASPAYAAGADQFDGPRIELRGGWETVNLNGDFDTVTDSFSGESNEDGFGLGVEVGYDFMAGDSFVVGGYAGVDFGSADFCTEVFGNDEGCLEAGRNFTVGVRAGVPIGSFLLYAKGGYSNGSLTAKYEDFSGVIDEFDESESRSGMHVGVGGELAFGPNIYGKAEYVYTNYSNADFDGTDFTAGLNASRHQILFGGGFRF